MRCPSCGKWNRATFPVCFSCGEPLPQAQGPAARVAAPPEDKKEQPVTVVYDEYGDERTLVDPKDRLAEEMQDLHHRKAQGELRQEELRRQAASKGFAPTGTGVTAASRRSRVFVEAGRMRSAYPQPDEQQVDYDGYTASPTYARATDELGAIPEARRARGSMNIPLPGAGARRPRLFGVRRALPFGTELMAKLGNAAIRKRVREMLEGQEPDFEAKREKREGRAA